MALTFYDLSNHQAGMNLATDSRVKDGQAFIFKATEGTGYVDKWCDNFVQQAKKLNKPFGVYHFLDGSDVVKQAEFFYQNVKGYIGQGVMVLDYEMYGRQGAAAVERFVKRFYELSGVYVWLYMNESDSNNDTWSSFLKQNCGLWIAKYSTQKPNHVKGLNVIAWQYTSTPLDKNTFYGDINLWNKYANKKDTSGTVKPQKKIIQGQANPGGGLWLSGHVSNKGWLGFVGTEVTCGSTGCNLALEAVDVRWNGSHDYIESSFRDLKGNWTSVKKGITGTTGKAQAMDLVCFKENGEIKKSGRTLQYRVHSQDVGWSEWKSDGRGAGTKGKKIEAIQMRMLKDGKVEKG